ncbi:mitomycin antibiotics/polyketide fumonisin biosynthesis protein [Mycolicibacterium duvalii]|uniref:Phytanoyl-CoA dioxygenase n=1 Tax=Mycolicibacterium duvalii TaxID=39688 RepID=A0A7I7K3A4_9MYCO|nr:phytanoyl-CoA dioxygenase family protein [Mycolicibacterium duvalii]MCV7367774.1 phytanoyl-CoA dioxygenase family protein [Mycolicibacterium duvalii]PEG42465.1 mitomycin antibiotics/polyketide fumonisin biosynthesis protein [Mycolicibacterium duvalii]BBX18636.1 phytanoyl-CoA dioxygenase [Mycolicibacterium duvalii]
MIDIDGFATDGFVKIDGAAPREVADAARTLLWEGLAAEPDDPSTWTQPVLWTADLTGAGPCGEIARSPRVAEVLDALCGPGGWLPRGSLGNIPVRFPVSPPADDRGWHIDLNTPLPDGSWAVTSRPYTLLILTLLSEVTIDDAPTRLRAGSHRDAAAVLGDEPLDAVSAAQRVEPASAHRPVHHATGDPGDVYLVHPLTVHAADEHRGTTPRFMAQGPVLLTSPPSPAISACSSSAGLDKHAEIAGS